MHDFPIDVHQGHSGCQARMSGCVATAISGGGGGDADAHQIANINFVFGFTDKVRVPVAAESQEVACVQGD
jgi:hypothetical protein